MAFLKTALNGKGLLRPQNALFSPDQPALNRILFTKNRSGRKQP
jgi:hypothetical protein